MEQMQMMPKDVFSYLHQHKCFTIFIATFFVRLDSLRPSQQFLSRVGIGLSGLNQY